MFTQREKQVIKILVKGCSNKEIAFELNISKSTVDKYISSIFRKMGVASRAQVIALVLSVERLRA